MGEPGTELFPIDGNKCMTFAVTHLAIVINWYRLATEAEDKYTFVNTLNMLVRIQP